MALAAVVGTCAKVDDVIAHPPSVDSDLREGKRRGLDAAQTASIRFMTIGGMEFGIETEWR